MGAVLFVCSGGTIINAVVVYVKLTYYDYILNDGFVAFPSLNRRYTFPYVAQQHQRLSSSLIDGNNWVTP